MGNVPTPFTTRLAAVWLSLRTRKLYWLLIAAFAMLAGGYAWQVDAHRGQPVTNRNVLSWEWTVKPHIELSSVTSRPNTATPGEARSFTAYSLLAEWRTAQQNPAMPRLEQASLIAPPTADDLAWLVRQPRLSQLAVYGTQGLTADVLSLLGKADHLRSLRILEDSGYHTDGAIAWPPNLEVVELSGPRGLTTQRLQELSRLPRLHTLSVRLDGAYPTSQLTDDVVAALRSFPALKRLYLLEMTNVYPELIHEAQRALPGVLVRPSTYDSLRVSRMSGLAMLLSAWAALVAVMLSPAFVIAPSVLWPGYRAPHTAIAAAVLVAGLAVVLGLMVFSGADPLTAAGLCGGSLAFVGLMCALMRRLDPGTPGFTQPFLAFPVFVFSVPALQLAQWWMPGEVDWFLRGEQPLWSVGFLIAGSVFTWDTGRWLTSLHRRVEAHGKGGCPLSAMDFEGWKVWALAVSQHRQPMWEWWDRYASFDRRLTAATEHPSRDAAGRRRLWLAGYAMSPQRMGLSATAAIVAVMGAIYLWGAYVAGENPLHPAVPLVGGLGYAAFFMAYMPGILLAQRQAYFPSELLRPISRADWVRDWFVMTARDVVPAAGFSAAAIGVAWWLGMLSVPSPAYWPPIALVFVGGWVAAWAGSLWLVTYRWAAIGLVVALSFFAAMLFALTATAERFSLQAWVASLPGAWTIAVVAMLLGAGLFLGARRRWLTREFAG